MKDINFQLICVKAELPAIQLDNGTWLFHAHRTCRFSGVASSTHESRWIADNIPKKWVQEFRRNNQKGRPAIYLSLPGFLFALSQGNSEIALKFRDEVWEKILPSIIENGGYISPDASPDQLDVLQTKLEILQQENTALKHYIDDEPSRLSKAKQQGVKQITEETINKVKASAECFNDDSEGNPIVQNRYLKEKVKKLQDELNDSQITNKNLVASMEHEIAFVPKVFDNLSGKMTSLKKKKTK